MIIKRNYLRRFFRASLACFILLICLVTHLFAQEDGAVWLSLIDEAESVPHSTGIIKQTITTSGGTERVLTLKAWSLENGDLSLMVYTDPARVKGDKILQRDGGDNIWYYMKRRDYTRHFTGHSRRQSAMGSDFSYEDLSQGELTEDYTAEFEDYENLDDVRCVRIKCVPTESGPSYDHLIIWAGYEDHLSRRIDYHDEDGLLKTLYLSEFKIVDDQKLAMRMEMVNHREGSNTIMLQESINLKEEPDASLFTKEALTREIL